MRSVSLLLEKFRTLTPPDMTIRKNIRESILEVAGVDCPVEKITIRNNIAYVACGRDATIIFLKRDGIVANAESKIEKNCPREIRFTF